MMSRACAIGTPFFRKRVTFRYSRSLSLPENWSLTKPVSKSWRFIFSLPLPNASPRENRRPSFQGHAAGVGYRSQTGRLPDPRHPEGRSDRKASSGRRVRARSEEHTSELQSLMRNSYAVFCLKKQKYDITTTTRHIVMNC